jgi:hypothetical protein
LGEWRWVAELSSNLFTIALLLRGSFLGLLHAAVLQLREIFFRSTIAFAKFISWPDILAKSFSYTSCCTGVGCLEEPRRIPSEQASFRRLRVGDRPRDRTGEDQAMHGNHCCKDRSSSELLYSQSHR